MCFLLENMNMSRSWNGWSEIPTSGLLQISQNVLLICNTCISIHRKELVLNKLVKQTSTTGKKLNLSKMPCSLSNNSWRPLKKFWNNENEIKTVSPLSKTRKQAYFGKNATVFESRKFRRKTREKETRTISQYINEMSSFLSVEAERTDTKRMGKLGNNQKLPRMNIVKVRTIGKNSYYCCLYLNKNIATILFSSAKRYFPFG